MAIKVRIRIDKRAGACDLRVEHSSSLPRRQHDAEGERWAADLGRLLELDPWVEELVPGREPLPGQVPPAPEPEPLPAPRRQREPDV